MGCTLSSIPEPTDQFPPPNPTIAGHKPASEREHKRECKNKKSDPVKSDPATSQDRLPLFMEIDSPVVARRRVRHSPSKMHPPPTPYTIHPQLQLHPVPIVVYRPAYTRITAQYWTHTIMYPDCYMYCQRAYR